MIDDDPAAFRAMLDFFYQLAYQVPDRLPALSFHMTIYRLADKYSCKALEDEALRRVEEELREEWKPDDFVAMVRELNKCGNAIDGLPVEGLVAAAMNVHLTKLLDADKFLVLLKEVPKWTFKLLQLVSKERDSINVGLSNTTWLTNTFRGRGRGGIRGRGGHWRGGAAVVGGGGGA